MSDKLERLFQMEDREEAKLDENSNMDPRDSMHNLPLGAISSDAFYRNDTREVAPITEELLEDTTFEDIPENEARVLVLSKEIEALPSSLQLILIEHLFNNMNGEELNNVINLLFEISSQREDYSEPDSSAKAGYKEAKARFETTVYATPYKEAKCWLETINKVSARVEVTRFLIQESILLVDENLAKEIRLLLNKRFGPEEK